MFQRGLRLTCCAALLAACLAAEQDTFERPNESEECSTASIDFVTYAGSLPNTNCQPEQCEYQEQAATLFDLKYRKDYKVVEYYTSPEVVGEISDTDSGEVTLAVAATYILYQCGAERPDDDFIQGVLAANTTELHFVEIPVTAVATGESTVGWMLEELDVLDRVRFGGEYSTSPCMQKLAAPTEDGGCDRIFASDYDEEPTNITDFDVNFGFFPDVEAKAVMMQASADPGPLARAEHIVYLSAFFNVEAKAIQYYQQVSESYTEKSLTTESAGESVPTVAWINVQTNGSASPFLNPEGEQLGEGMYVVVSFARYKALLTRDAGGAMPGQNALLNITGAFSSSDDIIFATSEFMNNETALQEALGEALKGVDVLIDETFRFPETWEVTDLTAALGLNGSDVSPVSYPFIANEDIWRHDKAQSITGSDDWFGEAVARPDIVHSDLKELFTPGSVPNHTLKFFRNFSKNETQTMSGPDECEGFECTAYAQQEALTAAMSASADAPSADAAGVEGEEGEEGAEVTEGDAPSAVLAVSGFTAALVTAGAVMAAMLY